MDKILLINVYFSVHWCIIWIKTLSIKSVTIFFMLWQQTLNKFRILPKQTYIYTYNDYLKWEFVELEMKMDLIKGAENPISNSFSG